MQSSSRARPAGSLIAVVMVGSVMAASLPAPPVAAAVRTITATTTRHWIPSMVTVAHGSTIRWHAAPGLSHTVKAFGGNWTFFHSLNSGTTVSRVFGTRGTFHFRCTFHSTLVNGRCQGMCGVIKVT
jgi:plastocyanin